MGLINSVGGQIIFATRGAWLAVVVAQWIFFRKNETEKPWPPQKNMPLLYFCCNPNLTDYCSYQLLLTIGQYVEG